MNLSFTTREVAAIVAALVGLGSFAAAANRSALTKLVTAIAAEQVPPTDQRPLR